MTENQEELENKAWYRLCKLCYVLLYVTFVSIAIAIGYSALPSEQIIRDNLHAVRPSVTYRVEYDTGEKYDVESVRELTDLEAYNAVQGTLDPSAIRVKYIHGGYATLFWCLGAVVVIGELVRRSFLYVVKGTSFAETSGLLQMKKHSLPKSLWTFLNRPL
jgi:hypothetical protein